MANGQQTVLITGGTDGLGKAAALLLAEQGYRVFAAGRSAEKRVELDRVAGAKKLPLESLELDVCDDGSVNRGVAQVLEEAGSIDVLINNAGIGMMAVVEELKPTDLHRVYETNIFGVLRVTQAVLPHMRERRQGRILMLSSVAGIITPPLYGAYSSSKHALEGLSNALRLELYPFGIDVVLIEPGYISTEFQQTARELGRAYSDGAAASPYRKVYEGARAGADAGRARSKTTPEDCARVILRAIEAPRPLPRYGVTPLATLAKWAKRLASDGFLDRFLRNRYGIKRG